MPADLVRRGRIPLFQVVLAEPTEITFRIHSILFQNCGFSRSVHLDHLKDPGLKASPKC